MLENKIPPKKKIYERKCKAAKMISWNYIDVKEEEEEEENNDSLNRIGIENEVSKMGYAQL